jgi:hypothetical protein
MTPPRSAPVLFAPGASTHAAYAPGREQHLPAVDERLVAPESRAEIVDGVVYRTMGSNQPHGTRHFAAAHVFAGALADGYEGAVDMLTRADEDTDAAPDISVFPEGEDEVTGGRKLEEITFEVLDTERMSHATKKVEKLAARGVRRLFAIRVAERKVYEWDRAHGDWTEFAEGDSITDVCFRVPVPVAAFVDRVLANDTVAEALLKSKNRVLMRALEEKQRAGERKGKREGRREGEREGVLLARRAALLTLLSARSVLSEAQRTRVAACDDEAALVAWFERAVAGEGATAILGV